MSAHPLRRLQDSPHLLPGSSLQQNASTCPKTPKQVGTCHNPVRGHAKFRPPQPPSPMDHNPAASRPLDKGAAVRQIPAQGHNLRLQCRPFQHRLSLRHHPCQHHILRGAHGGEGKSDTGPVKLRRAGSELVSLPVKLHSHLLQGTQMHVYGAPANDTAPRVLHDRLAASADESAKKTEGRAHACHSLPRHLSPPYLGGIHHNARLLPADGTSQALQ